MTMITAHKKQAVRTGVVFSLLFFAVVFLVYVIDDEGVPISHILLPQYLVPLACYALGTVWVCIFLYLVVKKLVADQIALGAAIVCGLPLGLLLINSLFLFITDKMPLRMLEWFF